MDSLKHELITRIAGLFCDGGNQQQTVGKLYIIFDGYDVTKSETALTVPNQDKNTILFQKFLIGKKVAGCTERTLNHYAGELKRIFDILQKDADQVTKEDLILFYARERSRGVSDRTIENENRVLGSFYSFLQTEEIVQKHPVRQLGPFRIRKGTKKKAFTEMEIEKMRLCLRTNREKAMFETLLSTGCRVAELTSIRISDIETDKITVLGKGEKYRTVYLNARAQLAIEEYLKERKDKNPYLFPKGTGFGTIRHDLPHSELCRWYTRPEEVNPTDPQDNGSVENVFRKIGKRSGVENVHPHRFRRTCATFALRKGMPVELVSKMLGHESINTTQIYLDISETALQQAHEKYV